MIEETSKFGQELDLNNGRESERRDHNIPSSERQPLHDDDDAIKEKLRF